ncbi:MAG: phosphate transporter rane protein 1, PhoT family [Armatimonadetes bacterium]|nr:phosphate transporter rane protein 1, PhoT family [Armatimonadota bacterium]
MPAKRRRYLAAADVGLVWVTRGASVVAALLVLLILLFLGREAAPALQAVGPVRFLTDPDWHPVEQLYGLTPMLWGTGLATAGALLLAMPLGFLSAIFCRFYAPPGVAGVYRRIIELLAGIPSVVYGLWGLVVVVPLINQVHPPGASLLAAILILALMILPTIALTAEAGLRAVPAEYLQAAAALGLSRWTTVARIAMPAARSALITSVILATGRALGETMAVLMVCGNVVQVPRTLFDPVRTLTANIALEMAYAMGRHRAALFVSGLVLALAVVLIVAAAEVAQRRRRGA